MTAAAIEILRRVRQRISDPDRWHGDADSRYGDIARGGGLNAAGEQVSACDPTAVRHCVIGALKLEAGIADGVWPLPGAAGQAFDAIVAAGGWNSHSGVANDQVGHQAVLAAVESALDNLQPSKALITLYAGDAGPLRSVALPTVERYADAHGYEVLEATPPQQIPPHWAKVAALREALGSHDFAVWIDGDAAFLNRAPDLADCLQPGAFQGFAHHPLLPFRVNSWLWISRSCSQAEGFLEAVWARRTAPGVHIPPWELKDLKAIQCVLGQGDWLAGTAVLTQHFTGDPHVPTESWGEGEHLYAKHTGYQAGSYGNRAELMARTLADDADALPLAQCSL